MKNINTLISYHIFNKNSPRLFYSILISLLFIFISCDNSITKSPEITGNLLFIASEGNFGQGNGSVSVFKDEQKIQSIDNKPSFDMKTQYYPIKRDDEYLLNFITEIIDFLEGPKPDFDKNCALCNLKKSKF